MLRCVTVAFLLSIFLSVIQILLDYQEQDENIDAEVGSLLNMIHLSASQAAYNIDEHHAETLLQGLAKQQALVAAKLTIYPQGQLASYQRSHANKVTGPAWMRGISDLIFSAERSYQKELSKESIKAPIGRLDVTIDTFREGQRFLRRAEVIILSGILRAIVLALALITIFYFMLTHPLSRLVEQLTKVDPAAPNNVELKTPEGHEKDELGVWINTTNQLLSSIDEHMTQRQAAEARATYLRQFDRLTDLPNRASFQIHAQDVIERTLNPEDKLMVICCDLNNFKDINSQRGFFFGDKLLYETARHLEELPEPINIARLFGDMFALLVPVNQRSPEALLTSIHQQLNRPLMIDDQTLHLSFTLGASLYPDHGGEASELVGRAERALSYAKSDDQHQQLFYEELDKALRIRRQLDKDLRIAIAEHALHVVYHPQLCANTGRFLGVEALARWDHPEYGSISPDEFIAVAEESDLILQVGEHILTRACAFGARLNRQTRTPISMAVNLSARQLREDNLVTTVERILQKTGLKPSLLELEITETALINDIQQAIKSLSKLRSMGIGIAIDDFGTGHASLNYLKQLPISKLKIDKSFVKDMTANTDDQQIVQAIISLGHSLGHTVVAEGVETRGQAQLLKSYNIDYLQGYHYTAPLNESNLQAYLHHASAS